MIKNNDKKTSPKQRIFFVLVAIFLLATTFMLYAGMALSDKNRQNSQNAKNDIEGRYAALQEKYQAEVDVVGNKLSEQYFDQFVAYKEKVKAFNAADVVELKTKDYVVGDGEEIDDGTTNTNYSAYYIGWLSDGTVFDSSFDNVDNPTKLKFPLAGMKEMIQGWLEGVSGMHIGGVREITIPSAIGYGEAGSGIIPANAPLKFIVMLIPRTEEPEMSAELQAEYEAILRDYQQQQQQQQLEVQANTEETAEPEETVEKAE